MRFYSLLPSILSVMVHVTTHSKRSPLIKHVVIVLCVLSALTGCVILPNSEDETAENEEQRLSLNKQELAVRDKYLQGKSARPSLKSLNLH